MVDRSQALAFMNELFNDRCIGVDSNGDELTSPMTGMKGLMIGLLGDSVPINGYRVFYDVTAAVAVIKLLNDISNLVLSEVEKKV